MDDKKKAEETSARALFRQTVGPVARIYSDKVQYPRKKRSIKIHLVNNDAVPHYADMMSDERCWTELDSDTPMRYLKTGYDRKLLKQLEKGKVFVDEVIDLHGRTLSEARDVLSVFLHFCLVDGHRTVMIIHGQGYNSANGPVLRSKVNAWLRLRAEVVAFANPPQKLGGKGATLCILKSAKPR